MEKIKLNIDNRMVEVPQGTTIHMAARQLGIEIPTLCYLKLDDFNIEK
jgi:NADP-reducing hydrogenase subunit HndD